jgi:hypothetical protein
MMFLEIHHGKKTSSANRKHRPAATKTSTMPPIEEVEQKIYSLLSPLNFKPLKLYEKEEKKPFRFLPKRLIIRYHF